ncbi:hypothetical protein AAGC94_21250 [Clostridium sporogenes]|uniref:hypothetical protein n=1 Tax=Clostridium sporogenes TaxID=1509 RepID=UPI00313BEADE
MEVYGQEPIIYEHMDKEKVAKIFKKHILNGKVVKVYYVEDVFVLVKKLQHKII